MLVRRCLLRIVAYSCFRASSEGHACSHSETFRISEYNRFNFHLHHHSADQSFYFFSGDIWQANNFADRNSLISIFHLLCPSYPSVLNHQNRTCLHPIFEMNRVTIWHTVEQRKISGMAAPKRENLQLYLQHHPNTEVFVNQDEDLKEIRRQKRSVERRFRAACVREFYRKEKAELKRKKMEAIKKNEGPTELEVRHENNRIILKRALEKRSQLDATIFDNAENEELSTKGITVQPRIMIDLCTHEAASYEDLEGYSWSVDLHFSKMH